MNPKALVEVLDFLNSIEGAGYGGMASFEIARQHVREACCGIARLESDKETLATGWESDLQELALTSHHGGAVDK